MYLNPLEKLKEKCWSDNLMYVWNVSLCRCFG